MAQNGCDATLGHQIMSHPDVMPRGEMIFIVVMNILYIFTS